MLNADPIAPVVPEFSRKSYESTTDDSSDPIYEDFNGFAPSVTPSPSPSHSNQESSSAFGTTFVELIKRKGSKLGVVVSGSVVDHGVDPVITGTNVAVACTH